MKQKSSKTSTWKKFLIPLAVVVVVVVVGNIYVYASHKMDESAFLKKIDKMAAVGSLGNSQNRPTTTTSTGYGTWRRDNSARERLITGEVIEKSNSIFKIKVGFFRSYIVGFNPNTRYFDRNWQSVTLNDVVMGHKVSAFGMVAENGTIGGLIIRDISLPLQTNHATSSQDR